MQSFNVENLVKHRSNRMLFPVYIYTTIKTLIRTCLPPTQQSQRLMTSNTFYLHQWITFLTLFSHPWTKSYKYLPISWPRCGVSSTIIANQAYFSYIKTQTSPLLTIQSMGLHVLYFLLTKHNMKSHGPPCVMKRTVSLDDLLVLSYRIIMQPICNAMCKQCLFREDACIVNYENNLVKN